MPIKRVICRDKAMPCLILKKERDKAIPCLYGIIYKIYFKFGFINRI